MPAATKAMISLRMLVRAGLHAPLNQEHAWIIGHISYHLLTPSAPPSLRPSLCTYVLSTAILCKYCHERDAKRVATFFGGTGLSRLIGPAKNTKIQNVLRTENFWEFSKIYNFNICIMILFFLYKNKLTSLCFTITQEIFNRFA